MNRNELLTETIHSIALRMIEGGATADDRDDICDQVGDDMIGDMIADRIAELTR